MNETTTSRMTSLSAGLPGMLANAETIAAYLKALHEKRDPEQDLEDILDLAEDLCADISTVDDELAELSAAPAK